ncbi:MAG: MBL fold metallo-hydrolase RNA specificity domain-containing protein [Methylocystaceae bacterium]
MKIRFLGAAQTVTGSCYHLQTENTSFLVDCGMFQGNKQLKERNYGPLQINPGQVDFMILTHAHIDHIGLLPKYYAQGFKGKVYCTPPTVKLASILLPDSAHIQEMEIERKNRKLDRAGMLPLTPIYTIADAENSLQLFQAVDYDQILEPAPGVKVCFRDAGHILGSASVEIWLTEGDKTIKIVFSGDLGSPNQPVIRDPQYIDSADYVLMESTYGSRLREQNRSRRDELIDIINFTMKKGGNLVIPAFAVERTQDLLFDLALLVAEGKLKTDRSVYIDSPLAVAATKIFEESPEYYDDDTQALIKKGNSPFRMPNLKFSVSKEESIQLNNLAGGAIIISASGMCDAGRIKHHLKHNLWRAESTVLFVGYQAQGTLGQRILSGEKTVTIHGEEVAVKADIRRIEGYSAHADQAGLMTWARGFKDKPSKFILVHGEPESQKVLGDMLRQELGLNVLIPGWLEEMDLTMATAGAVTPIMAPTPVTAEPVTVSHRAAELQAEEAYLGAQIMLTRLYRTSLEKGDVQGFMDKLKKAMEEMQAQ